MARPRQRPDAATDSTLTRPAAAGERPRDAARSNTSAAWDDNAKGLSDLDQPRRAQHFHRGFRANASCMRSAPAVAARPLDREDHAAARFVRPHVKSVEWHAHIRIQGRRDTRDRRAAPSNRRRCSYPCVDEHITGRASWRFETVRGIPAPCGRVVPSCCRSKASPFFCSQDSWGRAADNARSNTSRLPVVQP